MLTWLDWFCRHSSESLAALPASASAAWQGTLSENQVVYIDVPHGAVLPEIKPGDVVELRVILAANYRPSPEGMQGQTLTFVALLTSRGSERGRGRLVGVLMPDGWTFAIASTRLPTRTQADLTLKAPFVDPEAEARARSKAGDFLRLVLAYHAFGPMEAREPIAATPRTRLVQGKPRRDESLFAMARLRPAHDRLGRAAAKTPASWTLTSRQEVGGHCKLQPHGPNGTLAS